jgi:branched-chain amino acid transport system permease protein
MPNFTFFEPILISTLLNVAMTLGLYVTALSGQLSLATAAIAGVGGYTAGVLTSRYGVPFIPAVVAAAAMGAALGTLLAALTARMRDFIVKLTTLAAGEALSVLAFNWDYIGGANSLTGLQPYTGLFTCTVVAAIALFVAWRFDGSRLGYASRAVRDDPLAAASMGVSVLKVRVITFALGSAMIGMAGAAQAHYLLVVTPSQLGFFVSLNFIIFLLFGGLQTLAGPVLGAVVLTALPEALRFANEYRLIIYGFIIVIVMLWRPDGLLARRPLGAARRILGLTLRHARIPKGTLSGDDVLASVAISAHVPHDRSIIRDNP